MKKGPWSKFRVPLVLSLLTAFGVVGGKYASPQVMQTPNGAALVKDLELRQRG